MGSSEVQFICSQAQARVLQTVRALGLRSGVARSLCGEKLPPSGVWLLAADEFSLLAGTVYLARFERVKISLFVLVLSL